MELELDPVKIKHILEASTVMIKEKAFAHSINLVTDVPSEFDDFEMMADERKLKQIIFNLLSNAAKFTPDGGQITVACKKEGEQLVVSVTDTGFGISAEETEKVFEEFYQTKAGSKSTAASTGLGLPLSRSFVEMHGGKIWAESEGKDKGSRFTFAIPIIKLQILIIDDEPVIGRLFRDSLGDHIYQVTTTLSSLEALELIRNRQFNLIFLDLLMPELDGAELFRQIRLVNSGVPVVIITGYPDSEIMNRAIEYGPITVLKKPFTGDEILNIVHSFT
jgi:CheY-like chemotaxis protein